MQQTKRRMLQQQVFRSSDGVARSRSKEWRLLWSTTLREPWFAKRTDKGDGHRANSRGFGNANNENGRRANTTQVRSNIIQGERNDSAPIDDEEITCVKINLCEVYAGDKSCVVANSGEIHLYRNELRVFEERRLATVVKPVTDIFAIYLVYKDEDSQGICYRTSELALNVRSPPRLFRFLVNSFEARSILANQLCELMPTLRVAHCASSSLDKVFGSQVFPTDDSDLETIYPSEEEYDSSDEERLNKTSNHPNIDDADCDDNSNNTPTPSQCLRKQSSMRLIKKTPNKTPSEAIPPAIIGIAAKPA